MDKRILVILFAGGLIGGACVWKVTKKYPPQPRAEDLVFKQPAPRIPPLYNQESKMVRFDSYLSRHDIFVVFYNGDKGVDNSEIMQFLKQRKDAFDRKGAKVFGISGALPQQNIGTTEVIEKDGQRINKRNKYPYPLLTDLGYAVHQNWGRYDLEINQPQPGLIFVDRAGNVDFKNSKPKPIANPQQFIREYLGETP
ncbi:MAG: redoxin domain-containing protein [Planctomycetaceae bacterium]|jgi:peroxiredoxin|nr:peroxiredoxin family protein [bacterium]MDB4679499.1 peroxiredoxin family protein [Planctomycetaceae bacterium]MDG2388134.1 redoxin domain-containing protein [Planctomycetaceae bacterium]